MTNERSILRNNKYKLLNIKEKNILYNEVYFHTETSLQGLPGDGIHAVFLTVSASAT